MDTPTASQTSARYHLWVLRARSRAAAQKHGPRSLAECLSLFGMPKRTEIEKAYVGAACLPHFEAGLGKGTLIEIDKDGMPTPGRFVGRFFQSF